MQYKNINLYHYLKPYWYILWPILHTSTHEGTKHQAIYKTQQVPKHAQSESYCDKVSTT